MQNKKHIYKKVKKLNDECINMEKRESILKNGSLKQIVQTSNNYRDFYNFTNIS